MALGERLKFLRAQAGLSGTELARRAGVSPSLISRIERNHTTPSISVLMRITKNLGVPIGAFFDPDDKKGPTTQAKRVWIVRKDERKILSLPKSNLTYELLTPDLGRMLEFILVEKAPGTVSLGAPFVHEGEESIFVMKGRVHLVVGDEEFDLEEGDCVTLDSSVPHYTVNPTEEKAILIAAITPPNF